MVLLEHLGGHDDALADRDLGAAHVDTEGERGPEAVVVHVVAGGQGGRLAGYTRPASTGGEGIERAPHGPHTIPHLLLRRGRVGRERNVARARLAVGQSLGLEQVAVHNALVTDKVEQIGVADLAEEGRAGLEQAGNLLRHLVRRELLGVHGCMAASKDARLGRQEGRDGWVLLRPALGSGGARLALEWYAGHAVLCVLW